jgi:hypothetical protein
MIEVTIESDRYSDETRKLEDQFKEAIYIDLDSRNLDYGSVSREKIAEVSTDLRSKHAAAIESFEAAFARDEVKAGSSQSDAQLRAKTYVSDYFQSLWDVQMDLNK